MKSFALALGGGGARGLAHIAVLEAIDEMGVKPVAIAGTSIGALVGAAYAAGMSAKESAGTSSQSPTIPAKFGAASLLRAPARSGICSPAPSARRRSSTRKNSARSSCRRRCPRISPRCRFRSS